MPLRFPKSIQPTDLDRLHQATEIIIQDLENSPSLMELARQVELNDYKLKAGFRRVFGTTVERKETTSMSPATAESFVQALYHLSPRFIGTDDINNNNPV